MSENPLSTTQKAVLSRLALDPTRKVYFSARRAKKLHEIGAIEPWEGGWLITADGIKWATRVEDSTMLNRLLKMRLGNGVYLSNEEAVCVLNALKRSAEAMPEPTDTVVVHGARIVRERKLADKIRARMT